VSQQSAVSRNLRFSRGARTATGDQYSRFVAAMKRALPAIAVALLLLVALWPRVELSLRPMADLPRLDPRQARDLRMLDARYTGIDRRNRPFVLTADAAQQMSADVNDLVGLEGPKGDLSPEGAGWSEVSAYAGTYQPKTQILDLFGNVAIFSERGDEFHTDVARMDLANNTSEGHEPVTGQGPFGHIEAEGFRTLDRGDTIFFTGHAHVELAPRSKTTAK
jgi:lipopolysaccharide export system protein LptC